MNKLSKEKRNQLIIVIGCTLGVLAAVYFFLVRPQFDGLQQIAQSKADAVKKLQQYKDAIKKASATAGDLQVISTNLANSESDIANGDIYAWTYDMFRRFKANYHVDIPNIGQPSSVTEVDLLPGFPYKQIKLNINGTGFFHDIGKFVADFENTFPHMRMANLSIESANGTGADAEKLSFHVDIIILVKTT